MKPFTTPLEGVSRTRRMILASLLAVVPACLTGEVLIGWDFSPLTNGGNGFLDPSFLAPNVSSDSGLVRYGLQNISNPAFNAWGGRGWSITAASAEEELAAGRYFEFDLKAGPGTTISLSRIKAFNVRRSDTGPSMGQLQFLVNTEGDPTWINLGGPITWGSVLTASGNPQPEVDLSGYPQLQNVAPEVRIDFRIVCWGATNIQGTWYLNDPEDDLDLDFVIEGSTTSGLDYAAWISGYDVEGQDGFTEDFDKDGLSNGMESVLGSNPTLPSRGILSVTGTSNSVTLQHERAETVPGDVGVSYEWSPDMVQWFSSGLGAGLAVSVSDPELILDGMPNDLMEVTATLTSGQASALFLRIKAERP
jgi:hypothetical protein